MEPVDSDNSSARQDCWRYDCPDKSSRVRHFTGHVTYLGGAEGERLRGELAQVVRDLLLWAAAAQDEQRRGSTS
jgi:hypothetical protein